MIVIYTQTLRQIKMSFFFGDGNVSVKEDRDILKFTLTLNVFFLRAQSAIYLIFYCILLFSICFSALKFCNIASINFVMVISTKKIWKYKILYGDVTKWRMIMYREPQQNCN